MQELILIRGLPGSGKSTFASQIAKGLEQLVFHHFVHIETDMYFNKGKHLEYLFDASKLPEAHQWTQNWCREELKEGNSVIVSNTFSRIWEMQPYLDMAKEFDCKVTVITCEGNYGNIHGVPEETINKMKSRWEKYDV